MIDKVSEKNRYEKRFNNSLRNFYTRNQWGAKAQNRMYREPYNYYEKIIKDNVKKGEKILELGSGDGCHTKILLSCGANVIASDISTSALKIIKSTLGELYPEQLETKTADIENLPFDSEKFDYVTCAGSLSYGEKTLVIKEIKRVLKKNGKLICVDSLNHNPIYKLNRFIQYLFNRRSYMTIRNMPDQKTLSLVSKMFRSHNIKFFGSITWFGLFLRPIIGEKKTASLISFTDRLINTKKSSFKFVLVATK